MIVNLTVFPGHQNGVTATYLIDHVFDDGSAAHDIFCFNKLFFSEDALKEKHRQIEKARYENDACRAFVISDMYRLAVNDIAGPDMDPALRTHMNKNFEAIKSSFVARYGSDKAEDLENLAAQKMTRLLAMGIR